MMKPETRYGKFKMNWKKGLLPAIVVGTATYILCRYYTANGFMAGYMVGTPDQNDLKQAAAMFGPDWEKWDFR